MRLLTVALIAGAAFLVVSCATPIRGQAVVTCVKATETSWSGCVISETSGDPEMDAMALAVAGRVSIQPGTHEARLAVGERGTRTIHLRAE